MNQDEITCEWCGKEITEYTEPYLNGEAICLDCEDATDEPEGECCLCGEPELEEFLGGKGSLMVVVNDEAKVPEGIYEILELPFYTSNHISMWLHKEAVKQLSDSTLDLDENDTEGFAIGFLCRKCCAEVRQQLGNPVEELC